jgi:hypothetical protein
MSNEPTPNAGGNENTGRHIRIDGPSRGIHNFLPRCAITAAVAQRAQVATVAATLNTSGVTAPENAGQACREDHK